MKTRHLLSGILLLGTALTMSAQNNVDTATLTSGGLNAGTNGLSAVYYGSEAGKVATARRNTFIGNQAGKATTTGGENAFTGYLAGTTNTTGGANVYNGAYAGQFNATGLQNVFNGYSAGQNNTIGGSNTFIGAMSGVNANGSDNVYVGMYSGGENGDGYNNTFIGSNAGGDATGSNNIFIGSYAGYFSQGNNQLHIDSYSIYSNNDPLIWGDFASDLVKLNAKVGVGGVISFPTSAGAVDVSGYKLFVKGGILTEEVRVSLSTGWADYVFADDYKLKPLEEVECFIAENGHLPNVPSAKQVAEDGIELGDMARIQQEKIEELTLYIIQQKKDFEAKLEKQDAEIKEMKQLMQALIDKK